MLAAFLSCTFPWSAERQNEVNLVFGWKSNQIMLEAEVDGRVGQFIVGSAQPRTVLDRHFPGAQTGPARLVLGRRLAVSISPVVEDLGGMAAGILGADAWGEFTLVIDYARQLVMISRDRAASMNGPLYAFDGPPSIPIRLNGTERRAILDTALSDTLVLPRSQGEGRTTTRVQVAEHDLGMVDIGFAETEQIRIGNRLLSKFLIKIDYRNQAIALWRDPRSGASSHVQPVGGAD